MAPLCCYCSGMTVRCLVDLAKSDFRAGFFPNEHYYHHHPSFADLEQCATQTDGSSCPLCRLILDSFQSAQHDATNPTWPSRGSGSTLVEAPATDSPGPTATMTMRDAALKLSVSDVRIALRARHVATGAMIKFVRMFDILVIRLGDRLELGDPLRVPDLLLILRVARPGGHGHGRSSLPQSLPVFDGFRIGCSEVDGDLGSADNLQLARSWLDECKCTHHSCAAARNHKPPHLPTRVIDVMTDPPRIVHACDVNTGRPDHECADYVALSHCWGGPIKTLLKTTTAANFAKALPASSELPANFRDAMAVTRALGIRYLWIDSLCIVQDSVDDWRHESRMMGDVYSRATVSLLAMAAKASSSGILLARDPHSSRASESVVVPFAYGDGGTDTSISPPVLFKVSAIFQDDENLRLLSEKAPLSERGWTLQEVVFSSRILFYGQHQMYWYCPDGGYKSTEGLPEGILYPRNKYPRMGSDHYAPTSGAVGDKTTLHNGKRDPADTIEAILEDFYHFIEAYTQRRLTFGTDKFPAVSSFAQRVHSALGNASPHCDDDDSEDNTPFKKGYEYMAGVWSGDFRRGLLFVPVRMHCAHVLQKDEKDAAYRAPSWSWAVTDAPITFLSAKTPIAEQPSPLNAELLSWATVSRDPNNTFGAVDDAHLVVRGRVCRLRRSATHFVGAYTWDKEAEEGTAWFDDPPTWTDAIGTSQPLDTTNGNCPLFYCGRAADSQGHDDATSVSEDMFVCTYFCPGPNTSDMDSGTTVSPDMDSCEAQKYTIFMVDLGQEDKEERFGGSDSDEDEDDDWGFAERLIHCLILRPVPGKAKNAAVDAVDEVFERVGCLILDWKNRRRVDNWRVQTMKLV